MLRRPAEAARRAFILAVVGGTAGCGPEVGGGESSTSGDAISSTGAVDSAASTGAGDTDGDTTTGADGGESSESGTTGAEQCGDEVFQTSLDAWQTARDAADDTYYYVGRRLEIRYPLPYADCEYLTRIVVEDGVVVSRTLLDGIPASDDIVCATGWTETGDELGTHDDAQGLATPPQTLDEVYAQCCDVAYEQSPGDSDWEPGFFADDDGFLRRCYLYVAECGCAHTGPPGWDDQIDIAEISFESPPR